MGGKTITLNHKRFKRSLMSGIIITVTYKRFKRPLTSGTTMGQVYCTKWNNFIEKVY